MRFDFALTACALLALVGGCASDRALVLYDDTPAQQRGQASLLVPPMLDVVAVDDRPVRVRAFQAVPRERLVFVQPGPHQLTARYSAMVDVDASRRERFTSRPVRLSFDAVAGEAYRLEYDDPWTEPGADRPESRDVAIRLVPTAGGAAGKPSPKPSRAADTEAPLEPSTPSTPAIVTPATRPVAADTAPATAPTASDQPATSINPLSMLQYWWGQASEANRQEFLRGIESSTTP